MTTTDHRAEAEEAVEALVRRGVHGQEPAVDEAPNHLYDPVAQAHNAALMQRGSQGHGGGMP